MIAENGAGPLYSVHEPYQALHRRHIVSELGNVTLRLRIGLEKSPRQYPSKKEISEIGSVFDLEEIWIGIAFRISVTRDLAEKWRILKRGEEVTEKQL